MCNATGKTVVAPTSKGARVWLQGLATAYGIALAMLNREG